jgi:hypothetical protein
MKNKNKIVSAIVFLALGLLIAIGPFTLFKVCQSAMVMNCNRSANAELVLGIIIAAVGVSANAFGSGSARSIASFVISAIGVIAFLIPNVIIGVCGGQMHCTVVAKPSLSVLSIVIVIFGVINGIYVYRKEAAKKKWLPAS